MAKSASLDDVFINCPFDPAYTPIFRAILFTLYACSFRPRSALEFDDGAEARLDKINRIIAECRYGIHDLSRTDLDDATGLPRFNMPFELGIFLGAKRFGDKAQHSKKALILDVQRYRYRDFISDVAGHDIHEHNGEPADAIEEVRNWLANVSRRQLPGANRLTMHYTRFLDDLPVIADELGFEAQRIPYADFERIVVQWLVEAPPP